MADKSKIDEALDTIIDQIREKAITGRVLGNVKLIVEGGIAGLEEILAEGGEESRESAIGGLNALTALLTMVENYHDLQKMYDSMKETVDNGNNDTTIN